MPLSSHSEQSARRGMVEQHTCETKPQQVRRPECTGKLASFLRHRAGDVAASILRQRLLLRSALVHTGRRDDAVVSRYPSQAN